MSIESRIIDFDRSMELREEWNALADGSSEPSVFKRYEWFEAAHAWSGSLGQTQIVVVYRNGELIGVCPLLAIRHKKQRVLKFLTVPDTQFVDIIYVDDQRDFVLEGLAHALGELSWDRLELPRMSDDSATLAPLIDMLRGKFMACEVERSGQNYFVALDTSWGDYYATRSRRTKKRNNLAANRLKKIGTVTLERLTAETISSDDLTELIAIVKTISSRSWKRSTGNSLDAPGPSRFITQLTKRALPNKWLSIWLLRVDGQPVAMEYQLSADGQIYALRSDFDETYKSASPSNYLNWKILESVFNSGAQRYYMGSGDNPYKKQWTDTGKRLMKITAYNKTLYGRFSFLVTHRLKPFAKRILKPAILIFTNRLSRSRNSN